MREIKPEAIVEAVKKMCIKACTIADPILLKLLSKAKDNEDNQLAAGILGQLIENAEIAGKTQVPLCQDTGFAVFFVELGCEAHVAGSGLEDAINRGVREGYKDGYLRKSIVEDPLRRKNTLDNTPAIIHLRLVEGSRLRIRYTAKGGGSENMSEIRMLKPADGIEGVKDFVVERVAKSGGNPCPPLVVGVGIGGDFEKSGMLAKEALFRELGAPNPDPFYAEMEMELFKRINNLNVGPMGLGGRTTALAVHVLSYPCHIASLPVAVNLNCHSSRHEEVIL